MKRLKVELLGIMEVKMQEEATIPQQGKQEEENGILTLGRLE